MASATAGLLPLKVPDGCPTPWRRSPGPGGKLREAGGGKRDLGGVCVLIRDGVWTRVLKGTQRPEGEGAAGAAQGTQLCTVFMGGTVPRLSPPT